MFGGGTDSYPPLEIGGHNYGQPPPFFTLSPNVYQQTYVERKQPAVNSSEERKRGAAAKANAMHQDGGFLFQLSLTKQNNPKKANPSC